MQKFVIGKSQGARIHLLCILLALVFLTTTYTAVRAQSTAGQPNFTLKPTTYNTAVPATRVYFILNTKAGATLSEKVRVTNIGTATGRAIVYPVTATTDQASGTAFLSRGDPLRDVASWIKMKLQQLTLAPGQSQDISFQIVVPAKVRPGAHLGGIVVENLVLQHSTTQGAVHINLQRLSIMAVQVNLPGTIINHLEVTGVQPGGSNGYQSLLMHIANNGDTMLKSAGTMDVSDAQGHLLQALPLKLDIIIPETSINYPVYVQKKALAAGAYYVSIVLRYGDGKVLYYSTRLTITQMQINRVFQSNGPLQTPESSFMNSMPLWQIILVAVAGILVLFIIGQKLYGLIIVRRRKLTSVSDEQINDPKEQTDTSNKKTNKVAY
jgi:Bacterial protein of unknown function (DUF916)